MSRQTSKVNETQRTGDQTAPQGFNRGWPFSMIALLADLRRDIAADGLLRGYASWILGQSRRTDEIYHASKVEGPEVARVNSRSGGWRWNPFYGWRYKVGWRVPRSVGVLFAFLGFYFRLFFTAFFALPVLALFTVLAALGVPAAVISGEPAAAVLGTGMAGLGFLFYGWLLTGDADPDEATDRTSD